MFAAPSISARKTASASQMSLLATIVTLLRTAASVQRQRQELSRMDASRLDDLGIPCDEARAEAARPFWDLPANSR